MVKRCRSRLDVAACTLDVLAVIEHDKLFTPGPVEVSAKTLAAFSRPMIGHRGEAFKALYREIHPRLQELFGTRQPVFLSTSSAWGVMEAAIRNLVRQRVLCCMCGAFSDKWLEVARRCGKEAEPLQVEWGQPIDPKALDAQLASGKFDTVTLIHNETSTGVMNPLITLSSDVPPSGRGTGRSERLQCLHRLPRARLATPRLRDCALGVEKL